MATRDESPLKCETCTDKDKENRNCLNHKELSEDARAVTEYTEEVKKELKEKSAEKVFSLGGLRLYECPLTFIEFETWEVLRLVYLIEDTKVLLHAGGWGDQPYWLVEAYGIYKTESVVEFKRKSHGPKC